ncbi:unnamed protein product [Heligmosomoides polygyrus]|uniref:Lig_chan-Glu_bd domain-containing protein n=1 Tax=Heligmosomoides polygyrus TaxID=6339 RepID=A0A3P7ZMG2_HELPZ|nr:unnamed protein product [Heligmosomoides polygyrus]
MSLRAGLSNGLIRSLQEEPFVTKTAENQYEGFCIDLLNEMAAILKFNYTIIEVQDGSYGIEDESGRWNGIIGVLQRHEADVSVSAVTITYSRVEVVAVCFTFHYGVPNTADYRISMLFIIIERFMLFSLHGPVAQLDQYFSGFLDALGGWTKNFLPHKSMKDDLTTILNPFWDYTTHSTSMRYRGDDFIAYLAHTKSSMFTFLEPLSFSVWLSLIGAYLSVSFIMYLLARFSPYEWYDIEKIDERDRSIENQKNQFSVLNSLWFAVGSLMQQGSDVIPRAAATRVVAVMWWMFTQILISSYTAQLAAFLTVERMTTPIESTADLASQQKIRYGTLKSGSTMDFFRESRIPIYERMCVLRSVQNTCRHCMAVMLP